MSTSLNRRELLAFAAMAAAEAAASRLPAVADNSPGGSAALHSPGVAKVPATTPEGIALVSAAYASAGYALPPDEVDEVSKQLDGYPGDFGKARSFPLDNGIGPAMDVSAALPRSTRKHNG